ncbi:MAG: methylated-DNA--[protein]-cysteine S-methyltransferase [Verrucomicrobiales bacterium]
MSAPEGTPFQQKVWRALRKIPYRQSTSYTAIANQIGNTKAVRAVGAANVNKPLSIFAPCHRVIELNGTLTG